MEIKISGFSYRKLFILSKHIYNEVLETNGEYFKNIISKQWIKSTLTFIIGLSFMIFFNYEEKLIYYPPVPYIIINLVFFIFTLLLPSIIIIGRININYTIFPVIWFAFYLFPRLKTSKISFMRIEDNRILLLNKKNKVLERKECLQLVDYHGYLAFAGHNKKNQIAYTYVYVSNSERDIVIKSIEEAFSIKLIKTDNLEKVRNLF